MENTMVVVQIGRGDQIIEISVDSSKLKSLIVKSIIESDQVEYLGGDDSLLDNLMVEFAK